MRTIFKSRESKKLKILYTTDFHGSEATYRKFLNAGKMYGLDYLIVGGDLTGKALSPIIDLGEGRYSVQGKEMGQEGLEEAKKSIRNRGLYWVVCDRKEWIRISESQEVTDEVFKEKKIEVMKSWIALANERYKDSKIKIFVNLGNDDQQYVADLFKDTGVIQRTEGDVVMVGEHEMISFGYVNPSPWHTPRELPEEEIYIRLKEMTDKLSDPKTAVFNFHAPPYGTGLDMAPKLSADLRPVARGAEITMEHVGSKSVTRIIEEVQPLIGLHGHIHEAKGFEKIGRTIVLNPGSEFGNGLLHAAIVILEKEKIIGHQFIIG
ncbi:MAG TPA: hypothetical protein VK536_00705 [Candidatus Limnocylindrales bacterium]|nr:hypothetical protein [Candidatus Limnocylindrales bacterium]